MRFRSEELNLINSIVMSALPSKLVIYQVFFLYSCTGDSDWGGKQGILPMLLVFPRLDCDLVTISFLVFLKVGWSSQESRGRDKTEMDLKNDLALQGHKVKKGSMLGPIAPLWLAWLFFHDLFSCDQISCTAHQELWRSKASVEDKPFDMFM